MAAQSADDFLGAAPAQSTAQSADDFLGPESQQSPASSDEFQSADRLTGIGARALSKGSIGVVGNILGPSGQDSRMQAAAAEMPDAGASLPQSAPPAPSGGPAKLSDFIHPGRWQDAVDYLADKAGLAKPETPAERIYSAGMTALPGAVLAGPEGAASALLPTAVGGAASQAAAEAGAGPIGQTIAGLTGGALAPGGGAGSLLAGGARSVTRGAGADAAAEVAARQAAAENAGTTLSVGQATGSKLAQKVERVSGMGWGGGPIHALADQQAESLGDHVDGIVKNLSQGAEVSPTTAGEAANAGAADTRATMKQAESNAYGKVDQLVPPTTPISVQSTLAKLDELATPTPGAEATTGDLIPQRIAALRENLAADLAKNGGNLPYSAVRQLRTSIGSLISPLPSDPVANGAFKQLYGTLSNDLKAGASAVSPDAAQAAQDASALYKANSNKRDALDAIVDKAGGPESVYTAATSGMRTGATKISTVMSAMNPDQQNVFRAAVIDRLGRAPAGQQSAAGDVFNPSTFLTSWSRLDAGAKNALFGKSGAAGSLRAGLDSLTGTLETLRNSQALKNPSGTADAGTHAALAVELIAKALHGVGSAASAGGLVLGNNLVARALTNPRTVRWLATNTKLPPSAIPNAVLQLGRMGEKANDPDAQDLASALYPHAIAQMSNMAGN